MSCEHPLLAVNLGKFEGKYKIKILPKRADYNIKYLEEKYGHDSLMMLPCGSCPSCRMAHKREWSVRCSLEAGYHSDNCMITLTYEDRLRPKKLVKRDLQDFIKNMRNAGIKFRYFACGEYGELNHNCHFHILCFGYWPSDAKYLFDSKTGHRMFKSDEVSNIWKRGFVTVEEFGPGSAAYVAGYVDKKLTSDEFVLMSKRPGIGERYFREHLFDIYAYDNLVGSFGIAHVPRYCDKLADQALYDIDDIKAKRLAANNSSLIQTMMDHGLKYKEQVFDLNGDILRRRIAAKRRNV